MRRIHCASVHCSFFVFLAGVSLTLVLSHCGFTCLYVQQQSSETCHRCDIIPRGQQQTYASVSTLPKENTSKRFSSAQARCIVPASSKHDRIAVDRPACPWIVSEVKLAHDFHRKGTDVQNDAEPLPCFPPRGNITNPLGLRCSVVLLFHENLCLFFSRLWNTVRSALDGGQRRQFFFLSFFCLFPSFSPPPPRARLPSSYVSCPLPPSRAPSGLEHGETPPTTAVLHVLLAREGSRWGRVRGAGVRPGGAGVVHGRPAVAFRRLQHRNIYPV